MAVILIRDNIAGINHHFRRQLTSFLPRGYSPLPSHAPPPRGSTVQAEEGAVASFQSVPSVDFFYSSASFSSVHQRRHRSGKQGKVACEQRQLYSSLRCLSPVPGDGAVCFPTTSCILLDGVPQMAVGVVESRPALMVSSQLTQAPSRCLAGVGWWCFLSPSFPRLFCRKTTGCPEHGGSELHPGSR